MKTDRIFGQPSTFRIIGKCLTVTDFGGVVQKARKNTASPAIVGGIGQADCLDGAELSALSSGWNKRPSGISGDQLTKVKNKAPPKISDGQNRFTDCGHGQSPGLDRPAPQLRRTKSSKRET